MSEQDLPWEDSLLERKLESDLKDLLKTLVAFANSVRPEHVAVILIGEDDNGNVQGVTNPNNIQKKVPEECDRIYPPIVWRSRVYSKDEKNCVRVEIEYDGETPHFGGIAWVRKGSETIKAPAEVFQRLIDYRTSIVREIALHKGKKVSVVGDTGAIGQVHRKWGNSPLEWQVETVNQFYVTLSNPGGARESEPMSKLLLSWDHSNNRLRIIVRI